MKSSYFIIGAFRSATTFLSRYLDLVDGCISHSEPEPNLNFESRSKFDKKELDYDQILELSVGKRISKAQQICDVYVEKQISLTPFATDLHRLFGSKFIVPIRDPYDVISSAIEWHHKKYPLVYREALNTQDLSDFALKVDSALTVDGLLDSFDYSLPRPMENDPYFQSWAKFSRFEMCAWYWSYIYRSILSQIDEIGRDKFLFVNTSIPLSNDKLAELFDFIEKPFAPNPSSEFLIRSRVNSAFAKSNDTNNITVIPKPTADQQAIIFNHCYAVGRKLGIYQSASDVIDIDYGSYWDGIGDNPEPYIDMYEYRKYSHQVFTQWLNGLPNSLSPSSVTEIGVGLHDYYRTNIFADKKFVGIDIIPSVVESLKKTNRNPLHEFYCEDITRVSPTYSSSELIFCHASIDNCLDIDLFLASLADRTSNLLVLTTYRGYFPVYEYHKVTIDLSMGVAFNDISPSLLRQKLATLGFETVLCIPYLTYRSDIELELFVVASKAKLPPESLLDSFPSLSRFYPYKCTTDYSHTADSLIQQVTDSCSYFSHPPTLIASHISVFYSLLKSLSNLPHICIKPFSDNRLDSPPKDRVDVHIRVDIDNDLSTAYEMAKLSFALHMPLSFYILPTASYYSTKFSNEFIRNFAVTSILLDIQSLDHEIGLHIDPYYYYAHHINGAEATVCEISYLRSNGLDITGITGHNCSPCYGAESVEIFKIFQITEYSKKYIDESFYPLGILDSIDCQIEYEGSFFRASTSSDCDNYPFEKSILSSYITDPEWMSKYLGRNNYHEQPFDLSIWCVGNNLWSISRVDSSSRQNLFYHNVPLSKVISILSMQAAGVVSIVLHPCYFGNNPITQN